MLVGEYRDVVDMDINVDSYQAVPDVVEDRAVVAMVGLEVMQMGEDTPMDCEDKCAEWDIRNEFEIVDGMPVYYGGELYDSDEIYMIRIGRILVTSCMRNMWIGITWMLQKEWN